MAKGPTVITVSLNPAVDRVIEVPGFALGAHQIGKEISGEPGGKGVNVARALAALGVENVATGFLGANNRATFDAALKDPRIRDELFMLPGWTRENVTITDPEAGQATHIRDVGLHVPATALARLAKKLALLCRPETIVIFSGSLPPGIRPKDFALLVSDCVAAEARVAVDTSGQALATMAGKPLWLIKPNAAELGHLVDRELPSRDEQFQAARELTATFRNVLLSLGSEGAALFTSSAAAWAEVPLDPAHIRSTVGCGDALLAAFVAGVVEGRPDREALADAVACGAASACTVSPARFEMSDLAELRRRVTVRDL